MGNMAIYMLPKETTVTSNSIPMALTPEEEKEIDEQAEQMVVESKVNVVLVFLVLGVVLGFIFDARGWWFLTGGLIAFFMMSKMTVRLRK